MTDEYSRLAGETYSVALDLKNRTGWGFGIAYNLNAYFALGFDFSWVNPRYRLQVEGTDDPNNPGNPLSETFEHRADIITGQIKSQLKTRAFISMTKRLFQPGGPIPA